MIEIYPNSLDGRPCETATIDRRMTVAEWLNSYLSEPFGADDYLPATITVEGEVLHRHEWATFTIHPRDHVEVRIEPKGTDPFSITVALIAGAVVAFNALMPALPGTPNTPGTGDSLSQSSVKGNKVKLGDPIREVFGRARVYPDYLLPPHKRFQSYREQNLELGLCVGKGRLEINADQVKIGDTQLLAFGDDASYAIYQPGQYVGGESWFQWWHNAPEVGASSTGTAGLELTATTGITPSAAASLFTFSGYTISIPSGAGTFPTDWTVGLNLRIIAPYDYTVTDGGGANRDTITGPLAMLNPTVGDRIEVAGNNAGIYRVASYTGGSTPSMTLNFDNGSPANALVTGSGRAAIGPVGLLFKIVSVSASSITVSRLDSSGGTDPSFPGFVTANMSDATVRVDSTGLEGGWRGPFPACPEREVTTLLEWDMFFPEGLCQVGSKGNVVPMSAYYTMQYRDMALGSGAAWNSFDYEHRNDSLDQGGFTTQFALPYAMRPEVRMRKNLPFGENIEFHDNIQWYGLKCLLASPTSYAGVTCLGLRILISDRLASQTENQVNIVGTRILPVRRDGAWQSPEATRELTPACAYVLKTLGYSDSDIDLLEFDRLSSSAWTPRGDQYNKSIDSETTAKDVLNEILSAGFAEVTQDRGVIVPVRDEPRSTPESMYTPQNMTEALTRDINLPSPTDYDGVQVTYVDGRSWTEEVVYCQLPGEPTGIKLEKITAEGVTDRNKAYQLGMRRRRAQVYRRDRFSWSTEMDALNARYLQYAVVGDDVPGYGQSALLEGYEAVAGGGFDLFVSEPMVAVGAGLATVRRQDGSAAGPYSAYKKSDYVIHVSGLDFSPETDWVREPPHVLFGPIQRWSYPVLVTDVSPDGIESAKVEAMNYDGRVYLDDNSVAP